jgi:hypothetical protein
MFYLKKKQKFYLKKKQDCPPNAVRRLMWITFSGTGGIETPPSSQELHRSSTRYGVEWQCDMFSTSSFTGGYQPVAPKGANSLGASLSNHIK